MDLNQMMVISAYVLGDQTAKKDAMEVHDLLKHRNSDWVMSPIGMYLEEDLINPGSRVCGLLKDKARQHLSKIVKV